MSVLKLLSGSFTPDLKQQKKKQQNDLIRGARKTVQRPYSVHFRINDQELFSVENRDLADALPLRRKYSVLRCITNHYDAMYTNIILQITINTHWIIFKPQPKRA